MTTLKKFSLATAFVLISASTFAQGPILFTCTQENRLQAETEEKNYDVMPVYGSTDEERQQFCLDIAKDLNSAFETALIERFNNNLKKYVENTRFEHVSGDGYLYTQEKHHIYLTTKSNETGRRALFVEITNSPINGLKGKEADRYSNKRIQVSNFYGNRLNQLMFKLKKDL